MQEQLRFVKRGDYSIPLPDNVVVNAKGEALGFWAWVIANPKVGRDSDRGRQESEDVRWGVLVAANRLLRKGLSDFEGDSRKKQPSTRRSGQSTNWDG
jgi:hypothetical protein